MQRLFSTFANGWPGAGLLLQRSLKALLLIRAGVFVPFGTPTSPWMIPQLMGSLAGVFFIAGLWTPMVGALVAGLQLWAVVTRTGELWVSVTLFTLGGTIAMIGQGAWSLDARIFGRERFENGTRLLVSGMLPSLTSLQETIRLLALAATGEVERDLAYRSEPSNRRSLFVSLMASLRWVEFG